MNELKICKPEEISVIDLFSGPGGLSLGLRDIGFSVVGAVESDKYASLTYRENLRGVELLSQKVENIDGDKLRDLLSRKSFRKFLLVGGPPCQPYSSANMQNNGSKHPSVSAVDHFCTSD